MPMSAIRPIGTVTVGMPSCLITRLPFATQVPLRHASSADAGLVSVSAGPDVGDRREHHRVQAEGVELRLEVDPPGPLEAAHPVPDRRDVEQRGTPAFARST